MIEKATVSAELLSPGSRLGKYELIRRLAVGGMAEIFLARATGIEGFQKLVVLKRILPQYAANADFVSMFLDEARLCASLHHPNIAQVYDIGQADGSYFFTMEFVHGEDLRNVRKLGRKLGVELPLEHALSIVTGAAAGLHAAHEKQGLDGEPLGIVHRDVSPSNVLVSFDGNVKVVDFGIAKASRRQTESRSGAIKGKVSYMSPEQCRGEEVDRRSDVFALGILLYELSTGVQLFSDDSDFAVIQQILRGDVTPPRERFPYYPVRLDEIVMRALAKSREQRYPTAQALQLDIEAFAREQGLTLSSVALAEFMKGLFSEKLKLWRLRNKEALARPRAKTEEESSEACAGGGEEVVSIRAETPGGSRCIETWMFDSIDSEQRPAPRRRRRQRGWLLAGLGAAALLAALAGLHLASEAGGAGNPPPAILEPAAALPVTDPEQLSVEVPVPVPAAPDEGAEGAVEEREEAAAPRQGEELKKRRDKRPRTRGKRSRGWDPDSALPPM